MVGKDKGVTIKVSKLFFDKVFEPERIKMQKSIGTKVGQINFTEFLARKQVKFNFPPPNPKFIPKESLRRRKK